jgi:hypothetical protein
VLAVPKTLSVLEKRPETALVRAYGWSLEKCSRFYVLDGKVLITGGIGAASGARAGLPDFRPIKIWRACKY